MANYPTTNYTALTERFKSIAGLQSLETTDAAFLRQSINRRARTAYERYPWPDFVVIGENVTIPDSENELQTYGTGVDLSSDANVVFRIHKQDPTSTRYPEEYTFVSHLNSSGYPAVKIITPDDLSSEEVYVTYRKDLDSIITEDGSYSSGLFGDENNDNPNIPYAFFEYMAFGAYADFLRGDGQTEKAQVEDQNAEIILRSEIDKVRNQSRQFRHDVLQYRPMTQFRRHNLQAGGTPIDPNQQVLNNNVQ